MRNRRGAPSLRILDWGRHGGQTVPRTLVTGGHDRLHSKSGRCSSGSSRARRMVGVVRTYFPAGLAAPVGNVVDHGAVSSTHEERRGWGEEGGGGPRTP